MNRPELEQALWSVLDTLREYLGDLVLVGGWVPALHFRYGDVANRDAAVSLTAEADLVVPHDLPAEGRRAITEILEEAAFRPVDDNGVVWGRNVEGGERIEFLLPHDGPARRAARPVRIGDQPGLKGLPLAHLWVLKASTSVILFPSPDGRGAPIEIRVPSLAPFVLNKANTFSLRGGRDGRIKSGKDLVYLRDVMAAGERAQQAVKDELEFLLTGEHAAGIAAEVRRAGVHLRLVAKKYYPEAIDILVARDDVTQADAQADLEGYLTDLSELLDVTYTD